MSLVLCSCTIPVRESSLFWPHKSKGPTLTGHQRLTKEDLAIETVQSNRITGYVVLCRGARDLLLYFPGRGENANDDFARVKLLAEGYHLNVAIFDYRGYGSSTGKPGFRSLLMDAETIYDYMVARFRPARILAYGRSLGTVPAENLGANRRLDGLILEAGFTNARDAFPAMSDGLPWPLSRLIRMKAHKRLADMQPQPEQLIAQVDCPLLVMHGTEDRSFPVSMAESLYRAAPSINKKLLIVPGAKHAMDIANPPVSLELSEFLRSCQPNLTDVGMGFRATGK